MPFLCKLNSSGKKVSTVLRSQSSHVLTEVSSHIPTVLTQALAAPHLKWSTYMASHIYLFVLTDRPCLGYWLWVWQIKPEIILINSKIFVMRFLLANSMVTEATY